ncbi:MAG: PilZ domain-containing protein [Magnetococcales bacterium]|nr:PilZ domain-containing protein [Magnetococcales bacterium]
MKKKESSTSSHDRRQFSRVDFRHELIMRDSKGREFKGAFNDISLRGMLFHSDPLPDEGETLSGLLPLGEDAMTISGVVLRASPERGAAVRFENMDVESFSHLRRLVSLNMGDAERIDSEFFHSL